MADVTGGQFRLHKCSQSFEIRGVNRSSGYAFVFHFCTYRWGVLFMVFSFIFFAKTSMIQEVVIVSRVFCLCQLFINSFFGNIAHRCWDDILVLLVSLSQTKPRSVHPLGNLVYESINILMFSLCTYPQTHHYFVFLTDLKVGRDLLRLYKVKSLSLAENSLWETC